jgi:hypothetical protein
MVLVQILITPANNGSFFPVGISGLCSLRVLSYSHHDTGAAARVIQVVSEQLVFPYSPARHFTVMTNQHSTHTTDGSNDGSYHLINVVLNGGLTLRVINQATGAEPGGFTFGLLTLSIDEINRNMVVA